eukprot:scaffold15872_cov122-Isochrysis_galbana.AAC.6
MANTAAPASAAPAAPATDRLGRLVGGGGAAVCVRQQHGLERVTVRVAANELVEADSRALAPAFPLDEKLVGVPIFSIA